MEKGKKTSQKIKNTNLFSYLLMMIGVFILLLKEMKTIDNQYVLILGLAFLVVGIYTLAKKLPSKRDKDFQEPLVKNEK